MPSWLPIHWNGSKRTCNAMCNGKSKKTQSKAKLALSNIGIWNKTHQECARPNQTQMGNSDQTHGRCRHPKSARIQMQGSMPNQRNQSLIPICLSLLEGIGNNIEKSDSNVQAQIKSC